MANLLLTNTTIVCDHTGCKSSPDRSNFNTVNSGKPRVNSYIIHNLPTPRGRSVHFNCDTVSFSATFLPRTMSNFKIPKIDENDTSSDEEVEAGKVVVNNEPEKKLKNPYKSCNQYTYRNNNHNLWTPFLVGFILLERQQFDRIITFL